MKIRQDFVTNSSSSSFIFGEPGIVSGMTKKKLLKNIRKNCKPLYKAVKYMDNIILNKDKNLMCIIKKARKFAKNDQCFTYTSLYEYIVGRKVYEKALYKTYIKYVNKLNMTIEDFLEDFGDFYIIYAGNSLKHIMKYLDNHLYDFKKKDAKFSLDLVGVLQTYKWKDVIDNKQCNKNSEEYRFKQIASNENYSDSDINFNKIAFNQLGEFGIYGVWKGEIPFIIRKRIENIARLSAHNM